MTTALDGINVLGKVCEGQTDKETFETVKQIVKAMKTRNSKWPSTELCKTVYKMDKTSKGYFLGVLQDIIQGFEEAGY